jgi:hypothetical protein
MRAAAGSLLALARTRAFGRLAYHPAPPDVVDAAAAYTANLMLLAVLLADSPASVESLAPPGADARHWWRSTVRLWQAGLDEEAWESLESSLQVGRSSLSLSVRDGETAGELSLP